MTFVNAKYPENEIQLSAELTTLTLVRSNERYNVLEDHKGNYVISFSDQVDLTKHILSYPRGLFLVRYLQPDDKKEFYDISHVLGTDSPVSGRTIGAAKLVMPSANHHISYDIETVDGVALVTPVYVN